MNFRIAELNWLPPVDIVLTSHDHHDHVEADSVRFLADKATRFIKPLGVGAHLQRWGIPSERITERDWWQMHETDGLQFTAAPAQHFFRTVSIW